MLVSTEFRKALTNDDFARNTIEATRDLIYLVGCDFSRIARDGLPVFKEKEFGIAWEALNELLRTPGAQPKLTNVQVDIGGMTIPAQAIKDLQNSFRNAKIN
jgi:hypothetical protein